MLTLDDGPDDDATPAVLDALEAAGGKATFFVVASELRPHGEIVDEILNRGHEIGLHGYGHFRHDRVAPESSSEDVRRGYAEIEDATGIRCRWYRPPFGKMSDASAEECEALGMTPVYWSAWGLDWEPLDAGRIARIACDELDDGTVLLLHDSARYARRPVRRRPRWPSQRLLLGLEIVASRLCHWATPYPNR